MTSNAQEPATESDEVETGATEAQVEAAARAIHAHQEFSTCWDDEGGLATTLSEHGRDFYRGLARAALSAVFPPASTPEEA